MTRKETLEELKKIRSYASRMQKGTPSLVEVQNFADYSNQLKRLLEEEMIAQEAKSLIDEIPTIPLNTRSSHSPLSIFFPIWYNQTGRIKDIQKHIEMVDEKYLELELWLNNEGKNL